MSNAIKGIVKWFNDAKGFGFIEHDKGDVFVHFSSIETSGFKTLKNGEEVLYELEDGDKGLHAKQVQRINAPAEESSSKKTASKAARSDLSSQIEVERISDSLQEPIADETATIETPAPSLQKISSSISKKL
jgi:CspA family cold shock protein